MRPEGAFARKQVRFTRGFGHREFKRRECFECGVRREFGVDGAGEKGGGKGEGERVRLPDGSWYVFCWRCYRGESVREEEGKREGSEVESGRRELCTTCRVSVSGLG